MLASWVMFGVLGNEIRFADEILPGGQDDIPAVGGDEIRPPVGLGADITRATSAAMPSCIWKYE